jgi:hypothetical protein
MLSCIDDVSCVRSADRQLAQPIWWWDDEFERMALAGEHCRGERQWPYLLVWSGPPADWEARRRSAPERFHIDWKQNPLQDSCIVAFSDRKPDSSHSPRRRT